MSIKQLGILCGSLLLGLPLLPSIASAAPLSLRNPCPRIFYEEPYNSTRLSPQGCPPNTLTRSLIEQGQLSAEQYSLPGSTTGAQPMQPSVAAPAQNVIATIPQATGAVNVRLRNNSNAQITYQVIGQTEQRSLMGGEEIELQNLPLPTTLTMTRPDGGFIRAVPISASGTQLAVSLDAVGNPNQAQRTLRIEQNGQVLAY